MSERSCCRCCSYRVGTSIIGLLYALITSIVFHLIWPYNRLVFNSYGKYVFLFGCAAMFIPGVLLVIATVWNKQRKDLIRFLILPYLTVNIIVAVGLLVMVPLVIFAKDLTPHFGISYDHLFGAWIIILGVVLPVTFNISLYFHSVVSNYYTRELRLILPSLMRSYNKIVKPIVKVVSCGFTEF